MRTQQRAQGGATVMRRNTWLLVGVAAGIAATIYLVPKPARGPDVSVPVPSDLHRLEPQLQQYLQQVLPWVRERPADAPRQATLGLVYGANGLWAEARSAFSNSARLNPQEPLAHLHLAIATREAGDDTGALAQLHELVKRFPGFAPGQYRLGEALLRRGENAGAQACFGELVALAPHEWRGYAGMGEALLRESKPSEAAGWLEQAVKIDPSARIAHHLLGLAYRALGRAAEAERELALGLNARSYPMPDPWADTMVRHVKLLPDQLQVANDFMLAGEFEPAAQLLAETLKWHPTNMVVLATLGAALTELRRFEEARQLFERALAVDPKSMDALVGLAFVWSGAGSFDQALATAERAIALAPTDPQGHLAKAAALIGLKRYDAAIEAYEAALRADPKNAVILVEIGDIYADHLKNPERAIEFYERARRQDPALAIAFSRLAEQWLRAGKPEAAAGAIAELERIAPDDPALPGLRESASGKR